MRWLTKDGFAVVGFVVVCFDGGFVTTDVLLLFLATIDFGSRFSILFWVVVVEEVADANAIESQEETITVGLGL